MDSSDFDPEKPYCAADYLGQGYSRQRYIPVQFDEEDGDVMMPVDSAPATEEELEHILEDAQKAYARYKFAEEATNPEFIQVIARNFQRTIPLPNLVARLVAPYVLQHYLHRLEKELVEKGPGIIDADRPYLKVEYQGEDATITIDLPDSFIEDAITVFGRFLGAGWATPEDSGDWNIWSAFARWVWTNLLADAIQEVELAYGESAAELMPDERFEAEVFAALASPELNTRSADLILGYAQQIAEICVEALDVSNRSLAELEVLIGLRPAGGAARGAEPTSSAPRVRVMVDLSPLLQGIARQPHELLALSPRRFEELMAELFRRAGYEVTVTKRTRDGGADVIAVKRGAVEVNCLVECKRYTPPKKVGVGTVRQLLGVVEDAKATLGVLATTSSFSKDALALFDRHRWRIQPKDQEAVLDWIRKLARNMN